jgi:hypothetical protein
MGDVLFLLIATRPATHIRDAADPSFRFFDRRIQQKFHVLAHGECRILVSVAMVDARMTVGPYDPDAAEGQWNDLPVH